MARRDAEGVRTVAGGIISLADFVEEHRKAIEYDLLTRTGHTIEDIGESLPWHGIQAIIEHIGYDSALARDLNPEIADWGTVAKTNAVLADIYDILSIINANLIGIGSGKRPKQPKPYPRPGQKKPEEKKIGRGALPHEELKAFFARKRREHVRHA